MLRKARIDAPGVLHHSICRGIERKRISYDNKQTEMILLRGSAPFYQTQQRLFKSNERILGDSDFIE